MPKKKLSGGWMIEAVSSGLRSRRGRYLVAIADEYQLSGTRHRRHIGRLGVSKRA